MNQPELIQPPMMDVPGHGLAQTVAALKADGVLISRMERGRTNSQWRLLLVWPQHGQTVNNSLPATRPMMAAKASAPTQAGWTLIAPNEVHHGQASEQRTPEKMTKESFILPDQSRARVLPSCKQRQPNFEKTPD